MKAEKCFFTVTELTERWGIKRDAIYRWIESGELTTTNLATSKNGKAYYKISMAAVLEFEAARTKHKPLRQKPAVRQQRPTAKKKFIK